MAKRIIHLLVDDIDGTDADETIQFAVDGSLYEIDLTKTNARKLRDALAPFQEAGQRLGRMVASAVSARPAAVSRRPAAPPNQDIRNWAAEKGLPVSGRGRVNQVVVDAYEGRNGPDAAKLLRIAAHKLGTELLAANGISANGKAKNGKADGVTSIAEQTGIPQQRETITRTGDRVKIPNFSAGM